VERVLLVALNRTLQHHHRGHIHIVRVVHIPCSAQGLSGLYEEMSGRGESAVRRTDAFIRALNVVNLKSTGSVDPSHADPLRDTAQDRPCLYLHKTWVAGCNCGLPHCQCNVQADVLLLPALGARCCLMAINYRGAHKASHTHAMSHRTIEATSTQQLPRY
jgi:hypothetical protein